LTIQAPIVVRIRVKPDTGECCYVDVPRIENLRAGGAVIWDAAGAPSDFKIIFADDRIFGMETAFLPRGETLQLAVLPGVAGPLEQNYVIFCMMTQKVVMGNGGISPTIIIGD